MMMLMGGFAAQFVIDAAAHSRGLLPSWCIFSLQFRVFFSFEESGCEMPIIQERKRVRMTS
jgi:hypothetical protein